jgi:hypothetical protein
VDIPRNLKRSMDRNSIERLNITFVPPILERVSLIWLNCANEEKESLEKVLMSATHTVYGAKKGTRHSLFPIHV